MRKEARTLTYGTTENISERRTAQSNTNMLLACHISLTHMSNLTTSDGGRGLGRAISLIN